LVGRKRAIQPKIDICIECDKEILDRNPLRFGVLWYCKKCKAKRTKSPVIEPNNAKICEYCSAIFINKHTKRPQKYCSYHCKNNAAQKRYNQRRTSAYQKARELIA